MSAETTPPAPAGAADSVRGTIALAGTVQAPMLTLRPVGGGRALILSGEQLPLLRRLSGAEVAVVGQRTGDRRMAVTRFTVVAVDGTAATDGILARDGAGYVLVTADGRRLPVANVPPGLRDQIGARIWASGPLEREPVAYGIISPAP